MLYALVQVEGGDLPDEYELDTLSDDEMVEDASDDMYVVHNRDGNEVNAWNYFTRRRHISYNGIYLLRIRKRVLRRPF